VEDRVVNLDFKIDGGPDIVNPHDSKFILSTDDA
jgi:hypothetical protein